MNDLEDTLEGLAYIASSPSQEHGGFHQNAIDTAKSALCHLEKLQAENAQLKKALAFLAPKIDCALCPHKIGGCYRIEPVCRWDVMAWAMEQAKC
jgi:hypothetical protein